MSEVATKVELGNPYQLDMSDFGVDTGKVDTEKKEGKETKDAKRKASRVRGNYQSKLSPVEVETENRAVRNIKYLTDRSNYNLTEVSEILHVNLFNGLKQGFKAGLNVTAVLNASKLFGVSVSDLLEKDLEAEESLKDNRLLTLENRCAALEKDCKDLAKEVEVLKKKIKECEEVSKNATKIVEAFSSFMNKK